MLYLVYFDNLVIIIARNKRNPQLQLDARLFGPNLLLDWALLLGLGWAAQEKTNNNNNSKRNIIHQILI
jgi:hypothetical protein